MNDLLSAAKGRSDDWVQLIGSIVDIDSGPGDSAGMSAVFDVMSAELAALGFESERRVTDGPDVLVARRRSSNSEPLRIALIGHADTVFAKGTPTDRPFTRQDDRLTGPGVADMKAGLVVALGGMQLVGDRVLDSLDITFIVNGDEELWFFFVGS